MIDWLFHLYVFVLFFSATVAGMISIFAWHRRETTGGRTLAYIMLAISIWALTAFIETISPGVSQKVFWSKVSYIGAYSAPPLFLIFTLQYSQRERWVTRRNIILLLVIPIITMLLAATNEFHQLIWTDFTWHPDDPTALVYHYGSFFWVGAGYVYLLFFLSFINLIWAAINLPGIYRKQIINILLSSTIPLAGNFFYLIKSNPLPGRDITAIAFLITGALISWSIFRHQLLDITPIARSKLVDTMPDIVIVIDSQSRIGDLNPAAQRVLESSPNEAIGQPAHEILRKWPHLANRFRTDISQPTEFREIPDTEGNWYSAQISPLIGGGGTREGWLITLKDITHQRQLESALRASEELYRSVTEKANDGIVIVQDNKIIYCNPQLANMVGYEIDEIIGQSFIDYISPEQADYVQGIYTRRLKGKAEPNRYESEILHKSGKRIPVEFNVGMMQYADKPAVLAIVRDNTDKAISEDELKENARQQLLLNKITNAVLQESDFDTMLIILANQLVDLIQSDGCFITLWDPERQQPIPAAAFGDIHRDYKALQISPDEPTITRAVLENEAPLVIDNVFETPHINPERSAQFPTRSILAIPLIADRQKLGAALISFNDHHDFTIDEINLGEMAGQQISMAVLKARLLNTTHQRATEAETLRQAGAIVAATLKLDDAVDAILEQLHRVVPYDSASVQLLRENELEIIGQRGFRVSDELMGMRFPISEDNPNSTVIETRQSQIVEDIPKRYGAFRQPPHDQIRGWMGIPLIVHNNIIGMLALDSHQPDQFTPEHARLATAFAAQVAIALHNAHLYEEAHRLSITDPLTGIYNRRQFMVLARQEYQRAKRYNRPLSIIMMDIDHFKRVNDTYGHLIGDQVLREIALTIQDNLREADFIGRYGGEEFAILLPETPSLPFPEEQISDEENLSAKAVAQRIGDLVSSMRVKTKRGEISVTASLGAAGQYREYPNIEILLDRADTALYIAKQRGRNQVVVWTNSLE
jgi:diguanylate cyclase (GGDEF)-like protein/PAS domain S-box-containing protein